MKHIKLGAALHLLAAIFWMSMLFPLLALAGALGEGTLSLPAALYGEAVFTALAILGALFARLLRSHRVIRGILRPLLTLLFAAAGFLLSPFPRFSPIPVLIGHILFALICGVAFVAGTVLYSYPYAELRAGMPIVWLLASHVGGAGALWAVSQLETVQYYPRPLSISLAFAFVCYALCRNQANIDYNMERRRHRLELLPQKIRLYNFRLMLGILLVVLILFVLRGQVAAVLRALGWGLAVVCAWIFFLLVKLVEFFHKEDTPMMGEEGMADILSPFQDMPYESVSDAWIYVALVIIIGLLLWWKHREILNLFATLFRRIAGFIRSLFTFNGFGPAHMGDEESPYYTDAVVSLSPEQAREKQISLRSRAREWKRAYARCQRLPEGTPEEREEKLRSGYRLILQYLDIHGCYEKGDTVHELGGRAAALPGMAGYPAAADSYDTVRYGGQLPATGDLLEVQRVLAEMAAQIAEKKGKRATNGAAAK